jgi:FtsH-binding integral membrane protein
MDYINYNTNAKAANYDAGLRAYMLQVYNYMALALGLTGLVAFSVANIPSFANLFYVFDSLGRVVQMTTLGWVATFSPIIMVFFLGSSIHNSTVGRAQMLFWVYSALMGLSLSSIFFMYTGESITRVFLITSSVFGAMSLYGYVTKKDLTSMGSFLLMGLFGIVMASIVNIFLKSSGLYFAVSFLGVLIFTGLVAYDTQKIKNLYNQVSNSDMAARYSILGALNLYMSFVNLFIHLLQVFGQRRND